MSKFSIGDTVAQSMQSIVNSDGHRKFFKLASVDVCCDCDGKCGHGCPCSKCKESCKSCSVEKKASKYCCECKGKCNEDCTCSKKCSKDCEACGDGMMTMGEMVALLMKMSEIQDARSMDSSAKKLFKAAVELMPYLEDKPSDAEYSPLELAKLEDEEGIEDAGQTKYWLGEKQRENQKRVSDEGMNEMLDREFDKAMDESKHDTMLSPLPHAERKTSVENKLDPNLPLMKNPQSDVGPEKISLEPLSDDEVLESNLEYPRPAPDTEAAYKKLQREHGVDYGEDFEPGGWEDTRSLSEKMSKLYNDVGGLFKEAGPKVKDVKPSKKTNELDKFYGNFGEEPYISELDEDIVKGPSFSEQHESHLPHFTNKQLSNFNNEPALEEGLNQWEKWEPLEYSEYVKKHGPLALENDNLNREKFEKDQRDQMSYDDAVAWANEVSENPREHQLSIRNKDDIDESNEEIGWPDDVDKDFDELDAMFAKDKKHSKVWGLGTDFDKELKRANDGIQNQIENGNLGLDQDDILTQKDYERFKDEEAERALSDKTYYPHEDMEWRKELGDDYEEYPKEEDIDLLDSMLSDDTDFEDEK